jgi:hypothetical protein
MQRCQSIPFNDFKLLGSFWPYASKHIHIHNGRSIPMDTGTIGKYSFLMKISSIRHAIIPTKNIG